MTTAPAFPRSHVPTFPPHIIHSPNPVSPRENPAKPTVPGLLAVRPVCAYLRGNPYYVLAARRPAENLDVWNSRDDLDKGTSTALASLLFTMLSCRASRTSKFPCSSLGYESESLGVRRVCKERLCCWVAERLGLHGSDAPLSTPPLDRAHSAVPASSCRCRMGPTAAVETFLFVASSM